MDIGGSILGNIKYRNNVVTGEIATDNGNNTYDVYIASSDSAYPNIHTTLREPDFAVGEAVEILVEYGNKEMPIIIGRSKKITQEFTKIEVSYSGGTLVLTLGAYSITNNSAYLEGRISIEEMENCTERGFHYGTSTDYELPDVSSTGSFAAGCYNEQVTGLTAETTYHYQAYVLDANGDEQVGEDKTMTTGVAPPTHKIYLVWDDGSPSYNHYIKSYDGDGNYLDNWSIEATENIGNALAVDASDNVYTITSDQHSIKKRDSDGAYILTKTETNYIYNIAIGPDGYIYTQEYDGGWNAKIVKRNTSDLATVDTLSLGNTNTYYGMTIDSDGNFFLINGSTHYYEKWTWVGGKIASYATTHYNLSSLGVAGSVLANIHWLTHGIYLPKTLVSPETDVELEDMASPGAVGSMYGEYFLFSGYNAGNDVVVGKYNTMLIKVWVTVVASSANYGSVCSYPF